MTHTGLVTKLEPNEVFVFGSNEAGRHGRGAAFTAKKWGARNGQGVGHIGQTYAIPTKDGNLRCLSLREIRGYVNEFLDYAKLHPELIFLVTEIGCGLAGNHPEDIAPMFKNASPNVILPLSFQNIIHPA